MNHDSSSSFIPKEPKPISLVLSIIAVLIGILLFFIIAITLCAPKNIKPVDKAITDKRLATLKDVHSQQTSLINQYAWIDQQNNIVQIPIEQAMQKVVDDLQNGKPLYTPPQPIPAAPTTTNPSKP